MSSTVRKIADEINSPIDRIRKYVATPPENSRVFEITPEMAKQLLFDYNSGNRPKKPAAVTKYAAHMSEGRWALTGDTIKFSDAARLRDGQNRLMACARAGTPFRTHIVFGIADSAFDVLDQGRNRSSADILSIAGYENVTALAGAIRWAHLISEGRAKQRDTLEPDMLLNLAQTKYPTMAEFVPQGRLISARTLQPISLVVGLLYVFHQANKVVAREFATAWETGERGGKYKPIALALSQISQIQSASSGRVHDTMRAALLVMAWNMVIHGRRGTMTEMRWKVSDAFPDIAS